MPGAPPPRTHLIAAFLAVYFVWGSTYLAIRFVVEALPPFTSAGLRFLSAGLALYAFARARGAPRPSWARWRHEALVGALLLLGGNGLVVWAATRVASGLTALLVAIMPLWMVILAALQEKRAPPVRVSVGVLLGTLGVGLLVGPEGGRNADHVDFPAALVLVLASFSWALGSVVARGRPPEGPPAASTGMQMLAGGALLVLVGIGAGEPAAFDPGAVTGRAVGSLVYLCVFGSLVGFSAYTFLLRHATPAAASTYAYVNPLVAVLLGWALADEPISASMAAAGAIIIAAVAMITTARR